MFIELTLADGNRPWLFRWIDVCAIGRSLDDSATLLTTRGGTFSVVERPEIIARLAVDGSGHFAVARAA